MQAIIPEFPSPEIAQDDPHKKGHRPNNRQGSEDSKSAGVTFQLPRGRDVGTALCQVSGFFLDVQKWNLVHCIGSHGFRTSRCLLWTVYEMAGPVLPDGCDVAASFLTHCRGSRYFSQSRCGDALA